MTRPDPGCGPEAVGLLAIKLLPAFATIAVGLMVFGIVFMGLVVVWT